jgi:hypothetical protein
MRPQCFFNHPFLDTYPSETHPNDHQLPGGLPAPAAFARRFLGQYLRRGLLIEALSFELMQRGDLRRREAEGGWRSSQPRFCAGTFSPEEVTSPRTVEAANTMPSEYHPAQSNRDKG